RPYSSKTAFWRFLLTRPWTLDSRPSSIAFGRSLARRVAARNPSSPCRPDHIHQKPPSGGFCLLGLGRWIPGPQA
ncbi:MAG: hypothetical protein P8O79_14920, partial [Halieaceae bacterium]|nr:hypothetical protein [Halieaceae bacterium]